MKQVVEPSFHSMSSSLKNEMDVLKHSSFSIRVLFILVKLFEDSSLRWNVISFSVQMDYLRKRNTPGDHDWKSSLRYDFILFQALETKSYKKGPFGVFFHGRSDSLNMNDTEFSFIGLIKLNIERPFFGNEPILSQVHKTYEFGLVQRMSYNECLLPSLNS